MRSSYQISQESGLSKKSSYRQLEPTWRIAKHVDYGYFDNLEVCSRKVLSTLITNSDTTS